MARVSHKQLPNDFDHWLDYVNQFANGFVRGASMPPPKAEVPQKLAEPSEQGIRTVLICSPHPDDEVLTGALALRLSQEESATIYNLAVTLGSDPARKEARKKELQEACDVLHFNMLLASELLAFDRVTALSRGQDPAGWQQMVELFIGHLERLQPDMVLMPHAHDGHSTHIGVHFLVLAALQKYSKESTSGTLVVETEFWHPLKDPNLLVGIKPEDVALLVTALTRHKGEIARNPYHLRLPARLMDIVGRGAELIGGHEQPAPDYLFGEVYRVSRLKNGAIHQTPHTLMVAPESPLSVSLLETHFFDAGA